MTTLREAMWREVLILPRLIHRKDDVSVGIKTWGELIEENRARLQFFEEHLQHSADDSAALRFLQERHPEYLEGVLKEEKAG